MHLKIKDLLSKKNVRNWIFSIASIVVVGFVIFEYYSLFKNAAEREAQLQANIKALQEKLSQAQQQNTQLSGDLENEKGKNDMFERQIQSISSTVGNLEKLSKTDKELLQKYSKVYFLNENYVPKDLVVIDEKYLYEKQKAMFIHAKVQEFLYDLMDDAESHKSPLLVASSYRSFGEQAALKSEYLTTFGSGANKFSADQGYSEHQLGTTVDFTTPKISADFTKIESDPAYTWLQENAYKYGFILSYPKGNAYYQFEPWHWRFVGVGLATELHKSNEHFYDMPQREIDGYLIDIFD